MRKRKASRQLVEHYHDDDKDGFCSVCGLCPKHEQPPDPQGECYACAQDEDRRWRRRARK